MPEWREAVQTYYKLIKEGYGQSVASGQKDARSHKNTRLRGKVAACFDERTPEPDRWSSADCRARVSATDQDRLAGLFPSERGADDACIVEHFRWDEPSAHLEILKPFIGFFTHPAADDN